MALICKASELSSTKRLLAIHFYMSMTKAQQFNLSTSAMIIKAGVLKASKPSSCLPVCTEAPPSPPLFDQHILFLCSL